MASPLNHLKCAPFCNTLQQTLRYANHIRSTLRNGFLSENINTTDKQSKPGNTTIHNLEYQQTRIATVTHPLTHSYRYVSTNIYNHFSNSTLFRSFWKQFTQNITNFFEWQTLIGAFEQREFEMKLGLKSDNIFHPWIATGIMILRSISNKSFL